MTDRNESMEMKPKIAGVEANLGELKTLSGTQLFSGPRFWEKWYRSVRVH